VEIREGRGVGPKKDHVSSPMEWNSVFTSYIPSAVGRFY
jgi:hypothetical protein